MTNSLLIIGAGPGIGQAAARTFGRHGWHIGLASRSADHLVPIATELERENIATTTFEVDATDAAAVRSLLRSADARPAGLSAVLYNAANVRQQDLWSMTDAEVAGDLAVNVTGGMHTIRAAAEVFGGRGGIIMVTGGGLAVEPHPQYASLGAGKAALRNLVQAIAPELAARGIKIALATVATLVAPSSREADDVAEMLWTAAATPNGPWEVRYPA